MTDKKTFEIYILRKIPLLTNAIYFLLSIGLLFSIIFYSFLSSKKQTPEILTFFLMTTSYGALIFKIIYGTFASTIILMYIYILAKIKVKGVLVFNSDSLEIISRKTSEKILMDNIRRVYCNDSEDRNGKPNKKFTMTIEQWKGKNRILRIRDTTEIPFFIEKLLSYDKFKIDYFILTDTNNNWH